MFSKEFQIDGVPYLLESDCEPQIWPLLCNRVEKQLVRIGKEAAKSMYGPATVMSCTKFANARYVVPFKLTINPQGNPFR